MRFYAHYKHLWEASSIFYNQTIQTIIQLSIKDDRNLSRKEILIVNRSVIDLIFNFY